MSLNPDFFKIWSPQMAYVLGFMFADGSLLDTNYSSRTYYLQFSNNDLDLLKRIRIVMGSKHEIYVRPSHIMKHKKKRYIAQTGYVLKFGNKVMCQDLLSLGMVHRKSKIMHLPLVSNEYFSYFLRGYFDGDGCINLYLAKSRTTPRLSVLFTSGSTAFLEEIALKIGSLLDVQPPHSYKSWDSYNLMARGVTATKILDFMYSNLDAAPYLKRKHDKYLDYKNNLMGPRVRKALANS